MAPRISAISLAGMLVLPASLALGCSIGDFDTWWDRGIYISRWYWALTAALGVMVMYLARRRSRALPTIAAVSLAIIFHPSWTVTPMWGPDCGHLNVQASELVMAVVVLMLAYHAFRLYHAKRQNTVGVIQ